MINLVAHNLRVGSQDGGGNLDMPPVLIFNSSQQNSLRANPGQELMGGAIKGIEMNKSGSSSSRGSQPSF